MTATAPTSVSGPPLPSLDRALTAAFLDYVPDFVYFKDRESRFIALSASLWRYFGCKSAEEVIGKTDFDFFDNRHARPAFEDEQTLLRTGVPIRDKLEKEVWPDGRVTWVLTNKMLLRDPDKSVVGTFGISRDVTPSKEMEQKLEKANHDLIAASRLAGMAEVATGSLHNVGNVVNSISVSAGVLTALVRHSKMDSLGRICGLLDEHPADLGQFLTADPKGRLVPEFLKALSKQSTEERARLAQELEAIQKNVDHIKEIVSLQQAHATMVGVVEPLDAALLVEDSLRMNSAALVRHDVSVVRDFKPVPQVVAERGRVLQILINLVRNAKYALDDGRAESKVLTLRIEPGANATVRFTVQDNGVGIPKENLDQIFTHGFTTRSGGHGFGLHSSVVAAKEMLGTLTARSEGPGKGAEFTLELPAAVAGSAASCFAA